MSQTWEQLESIFQNKLSSLYPEEEIKQLFLIALEDLAQIKSNQYVLIKSEELSLQQQDQFNYVVNELALGRPIQHITGKAFFYKNFFQVSEHTLIPRPETEELVHMIIQDHKASENLNIIDIGTGTGCIPISISQELPNNNYWAVDISKDALNIAKANADNLQQEIQFINADILEWECIFPNDIKFDVVISNPPYITPKEKAEMHQNVLAFEPHLALFIEEEAPLLFYDHISAFAMAHLNKGGTLYFEINQYLSEETASLLRKRGFQHVEIIKDINTADRMIRAKWL